MSNYKPTQLMLDWHAALLEEGRKQTTGTLGKMEKDGTVSNCCLGVLSEVAGNVGKQWSTGDPDFPLSSTLKYDGPTANGDVAMPSTHLVAEVLGLNDSFTFPGDVQVGVDVYDTKVNAADLNDDWGWSFEEIAAQLKTVYIDGTGNPMEYTIEELDRNERSDDDDCGY